MNIFDYENLPKEINEYAMKLFLFRTGKIIFYKIGDKYLCQPFAYTDKLDWYYRPLDGRVVNPWLPQGHQNFTFKVNDEAVIFNSTPDMYNFREHSVVSDLIWKTSYQLAENDISYYCIQRNHRLIAVFTAETDLQKAECNRILERMYEGYPDITMGEDLVSHINVNPIAMNSTRSSITELIEFQQYVLANFYHSFGINSNYNLKREQLNSNEIDVNEEVLRLNIEDMLKNRESGVSKINELYDLDIRVSLNEKVYKSLLEDIEMPQGKETEMSQSDTFENGPQEGKSDSEDNETNSSIRDVQKTGSVNNSDISEEREEMGEKNGKTDNEESYDERETSQSPEHSNGEVVININVNSENAQIYNEDPKEDPKEPEKPESEEENE